MQFFVGSKNKVKLAAVRQATVDKWPEAEISGFEVESGVPAQPMSDVETANGAVNRARAALMLGLIEQQDLDQEQCLGVGLEGGVTLFNGELWSTVWVAVVDAEGRVFTANGARMKLPERIAQPILEGEEMGPMMARLVGIDDIREKQGMLGVVTADYVSRTEEYGGIAKLAIGLWFGREWDKDLDVK